MNCLQVLVLTAGPQLLVLDGCTSRCRRGTARSLPWLGILRLQSSDTCSRPADLGRSRWKKLAGDRRGRIEPATVACLHGAQRSIAHVASHDSMTPCIIYTVQCTLRCPPARTRYDPSLWSGLVVVLLVRWSVMSQGQAPRRTGTAGPWVFDLVSCVPCVSGQCVYRLRVYTVFESGQTWVVTYGVSEELDTYFTSYPGPESGRKVQYSYTLALRYRTRVSPQAQHEHPLSPRRGLRSLSLTPHVVSGHLRAPCSGRSRDTVEFHLQPRSLDARYRMMYIGVDGDDRTRGTHPGEHRTLPGAGPARHICIQDTFAQPGCTCAQSMYTPLMGQVDKNMGMGMGMGMWAWACGHGMGMGMCMCMGMWAWAWSMEHPRHKQSAASTPLSHARPPPL